MSWTRPPKVSRAEEMSPGPTDTTLFTIGVLAFAVPPYPRSPVLAPLLWCVIGAQAAFLLSVRQDLSLIIAGVVGAGLFIKSGRTLPPRINQ